MMVGVRNYSDISKTNAEFTKNTIAINSAINLIKYNIETTDGEK